MLNPNFLYYNFVDFIDNNDGEIKYLTMNIIEFHEDRWIYEGIY
jgi:hypothetical protein